MSVSGATTSARPGNAPRPLPFPNPWVIGTAGRGSDVGWQSRLPVRCRSEPVVFVCPPSSPGRGKPSALGHTVDIGPGLTQRQSLRHPRHPGLAISSVGGWGGWHRRGRAGLSGGSSSRPSLFLGASPRPPCSTVGPGPTHGLVLSNCRASAPPAPSACNCFCRTSAAPAARQQVSASVSKGGIGSSAYPPAAFASCSFCARRPFVVWFVCLRRCANAKLMLRRAGATPLGPRRIFPCFRGGGRVPS